MNLSCLETLKNRALLSFLHRVSAHSPNINLILLYEQQKVSLSTAAHIIVRYYARPNLKLTSRCGGGVTSRASPGCCGCCCGGSIFQQSSQRTNRCRAAERNRPPVCLSPLVPASNKDPSARTLSVFNAPQWGVETLNGDKEASAVGPRPDSFSSRGHI